MTRSPYETSVTRKHCEGSPLASCSPDTKRHAGPGTRRKNPSRFDKDA